MFIEVSRVSYGIVVNLTGALVAGEPETDFRNAVRQVVENGHRMLVINMEHVPSIDAAGIGTLASFLTMARSRGVVVVLAALRPRVRRVLALSGLAGTFDIVGTVADIAAAPATGIK